VTFLLLLFAVVCFVVAAFGVGVWRLNLVALGLALWAITVLITVWP
jgi:hypothetical protein